MNEQDVVVYTVGTEEAPQEQPPKLCPLLSIGRNHGHPTDRATWCECRGEDCAWWTGDRCAVTALAQNTEPDGMESLEAAARIWGSE